LFILRQGLAGIIGAHHCAQKCLILNQKSYQLLKIRRFSNKNSKFENFPFKKISRYSISGVVVHICNSSYLGGGGLQV
jgi:hypothetical protein